MAARVKLRATSIAGRILATIGVCVLLIELGLSWYLPLCRAMAYPIHAPPVLIGCLLGFVGFFLLDHTGALEGGRFVVQSAEGLLSIVRGGAKRSGDVVIGQTEAAPPAAGVAAPAAAAQPAAIPHAWVDGKEEGEL